MHPEVLRVLLRRQPFRPFRLVLSNNTSYVVRHPELALVLRPIVELTLPGEGPGGEDRIFGIALIHIAFFELLPPSA